MVNLDLTTMIQEIETVPEMIDVVTFLEKKFNNLSPETLSIYTQIQTNSPEILFPTDIDLPEEIISEFTQKHQAIYKPLSDKIVEDVLNGDSDVTVIGSGMYGGKSTLSFYVLDKLEALGYTTEIYIADVMDEDFVTARSYPGEGKKRPAIKYGSGTKLDLPKSENSIVMLDEFSFLDLDSVNKFVCECKEKGIKVILLGLNTNYLGDNLPVFNNLNKVVGNHKLVECKSFVPGEENDRATGTKTRRFININGNWILDMGVLPLVVSKELTKIVHYSAATEEQTFKVMFDKNLRLRDYVLRSNSTLLYMQACRLQQLEEEFGYSKP